MPSVCNVISRTYGLVIGVLSIILSLWGLWKGHSILNEENSSVLKKLFYWGVEYVSEDYRKFKTGVQVAVVGCWINVVASALLLLGIVTQCHRLLWPWLINNAVFICLAIVGFVIQFLKQGVKTEDIPRYAGGFVLLCFLYFLMYLVYKEFQGSRGRVYSGHRTRL